MNIIKTPFAMKNGKAIHISELNKGAKGTDYECYCCSCNEKLTPRLGSKNRWHFSHKSLSCTNALETGLHIMAKRILSEHKVIKLPKLSIYNDEEYLERNQFYYDLSDESRNEDTILIHDEFNNHEFITYEYEEEIVCKSKTYSFDSVDIEKRFANITADIVLYKNSKPLLIEIAVTHFIDSEKIEKIKEGKLSTIEVDLSEYKTRFIEMSKEELEKLIIEEVVNKKWIYNDKAENKILDLIERNKAEKAREDIRIKEEKEKQMIKREKSNSLKAEIIKNEKSLRVQYENDKKQSKLWSFIVKKLWID